MLILGLKPGHDGALAAIKDGTVVFSMEAEKDSYGRYSPVTPTLLLEAFSQLDQIPDVVALGGWYKRGGRGLAEIGAGYSGTEVLGPTAYRFLGKEVQYFSSSHERSHIAMALGMAPPVESGPQVVLVWEGYTGSFYLVDEKYQVTEKIEVLSEPGSRYSFLFSLADPTVPAHGARARLSDSGKLMALAAYGDASKADTALRSTVNRIITAPTMEPLPKYSFKDSPVYNSGVESEATKVAAAVLTEAMFNEFAKVALARLPFGLRLSISGGCGLNCDWNQRWKELGHFTSVFVPPCTNDSGSAIGTAIDAQLALTGSPTVQWDVYSGLPFVEDVEPNPSAWTRRPLDKDALARVLDDGNVVAWVQGRWEIGPRALGNRSLLASAFRADSRDELNRIKQREGYRPIAPVCMVEDLSRIFDSADEDPYMLYFRKVVRPDLPAITHVDGSARVQTVSSESNRRLHELLGTYRQLYGLGILCNTSLNFNGRGFINRSSDLVRYCEDRNVRHMVVGDTWYSRR